MCKLFKNILRIVSNSLGFIFIGNTSVFLAIIIFILLCFLPAFTSCGLYYYDLYEESKSEDSVSREKDIFLVKEVVDGDTIILFSGERIRLIGINAPEHGRYYFEEAKDMLGILIEGEKVKLEKDVTDRDQYGRLLRYIYTNDIFVNLEMVKRGFANSYTYPPDVKYTEKFLEAERYARENELGLWKRSKSNKVEIYLNCDAPGSDSKNLNGEYVTIKNITSELLNIDSWTIKDSGTNIYEFYKYMVKPGSTIHLYSGKGKDGDGKFYWNSSKPIWNNDHDTLYLRDKEGLLVEIYNY